MKGFIEVTQIDTSKKSWKTLVAVKEIMVVEEHKNFVVIVLDVSTTKKNDLNGYLFVSETYDEIVAMIKEATE